MQRFSHASAVATYVVAAWALWPAGLLAADAERPSSTCAIVQTAPAIDGRLDDDAWKQAAPRRVTRLRDNTADAALVESSKRLRLVLGAIPSPESKL